MHIIPLSTYIDSHSITHHSFAAGLQLLMSACAKKISKLLHSMRSCIGDIKAWATANMLKLNDDKTELIFVTTRTKHLYNLPTSITVGNAHIPFKQSVKNFGLTLHCHLTMNEHMSTIVQTCHLKQCCLAFIHRFMTDTATSTLVSAFVLSRIDYSNQFFMM